MHGDSNISKCVQRTHLENFKHVQRTHIQCTQGTLSGFQACSVKHLRIFTKPRKHWWFCRREAMRKTCSCKLMCISLRWTSLHTSSQEPRRLTSEKVSCAKMWGQELIVVVYQRLQGEAPGWVILRQPGHCKGKKRGYMKLEEKRE